MRILHISTRLILGGSQENTVLSCEEQVRRGHEVHLAFGPIFGPEGSMLPRIQRFHAGSGRTGEREIRLHEVEDLVREVSPHKDLRAVRALERLIEVVDPDVVHTHSSKAGILGRRAAWKVKQRHSGRPRVVHTIHGPPFMPVEGTSLQRLRTRMVNAVYTLAERGAAHRCDAIVSVADAMTEQFLARGIGRPALYTTVRSGVEVERYENLEADRAALRLRLSAGDRGVVIGTVARLAEHKGHDDLLDAMGDLLKSHPEWKLLWVGDGWWRERLVKRARAEMGLSVCELDRGEEATAATQLILTGLVPPEAVPGWMSAMDVLVHPSLREGLPRTVVQALLAGACPVAYDVDGTREVCIDGETGRLVAAGDVAGLREAVGGLALNGVERARLAARGRALVVSAFSIAAMCDGLERVYLGSERDAAGR